LLSSFFTIHICFALFLFLSLDWVAAERLVFFLFAHLPAVLYILGALYTVSLFVLVRELGWGLWDWNGVGTGMRIGIGKAGRTIMGGRFGPLIDNTLGGEMEGRMVDIIPFRQLSSEYIGMGSGQALLTLLLHWTCCFSCPGTVLGPWSLVLLVEIRSMFW
jgi:hypothetical protein